MYNELKLCLLDYLKNEFNILKLIIFAFLLTVCFHPYNS